MPQDEPPTGVRLAGTGATAGGASELELYKLAVEMADRISARRALANAFFLTVNTGLAALLGGTEWQHLERTKAPRRVWPPRALRAWLSGYHELGTVERVVPLVFAGIYVAELVRQAMS